MDTLHEGCWSPKKLVGTMIDNFMSYTDLRNLRQALSLKYDPDMDRFMHPIWMMSPFDELLQRPALLRWPEPIPAIEQIRSVYKEYEGSLKIAVSEDGKVACHRFSTKALELHQQHHSRGLVAIDTGTEKTKAHRIVYAFDAFPVDGLSIEHGCLSSASLLVPSQSEDMLKILMVGTLKENTEGLNRMHETRRVDKDFNQILSRGYIQSGDTKIFLELFICVDKKAVEMMRGCSPGCPWCECTPDQRLAVAWPVSKRPTTWQQAAGMLDKVCKRPFPTSFDMYAWAHKALPFETLPRHCKFCNKPPYKTTKEYEADLERVSKERADPTKAGKAAFQRKRSAHAASHARQYLHETSNLLVSMDHVVVEVMHLVELNVAKQCWTKGIVLLMTAYMREMSTKFVDGMGFKLDVKLKANGQSGTAWFKASVVNELVHGSNKVPGGLAPWLASLLFFVGEDFLAKQTAIQPLANGASDDALTVLTNRYGVKGQQLFNAASLWDAYKDWHDTTFMTTLDEEARQSVALHMAVAANAMMERFKVVAKESGKTWIFHIALFIAPRQVARLVAKKCMPLPCCDELTVRCVRSQVWEFVGLLQREAGDPGQAHEEAGPEADQQQEDRQGRRHDHHQEEEGRQDDQAPEGGLVHIHGRGVHRQQVPRDARPSHLPRGEVDERRVRAPPARAAVQVGQARHQAQGEEGPPERAGAVGRPCSERYSIHRCWFASGDVFGQD